MGEADLGLVCVRDFIKLGVNILQKNFTHNIKIQLKWQLCFHLFLDNGLDKFATLQFDS